jgi:hypothetical protein
VSHSIALIQKNNKQNHLNFSWLLDVLHDQARPVAAVMCWQQCAWEARRFYYTCKSLEWLCGWAFSPFSSCAQPWEKRSGNAEFNFILNLEMNALASKLLLLQ